MERQIEEKRKRKREKGDEKELKRQKMRERVRGEIMEKRERDRVGKTLAINFMKRSLIIWKVLLSFKLQITAMFNNKYNSVKIEEILSALSLSTFNCT